MFHVKHSVKALTPGRVFSNRPRHGEKYSVLLRLVTPDGR